MAHHITAEERQRMKEFATTPRYERSPHLLEPTSDDEVDGDA